MVNSISKLLKREKKPKRAVGEVGAREKWDYIADGKYLRDNPPAAAAKKRRDSAKRENIAKWLKDLSTDTDTATLPDGLGEGVKGGGDLKSAGEEFRTWWDNARKRGLIPPKWTEGQCPGFVKDFIIEFYGVKGEKVFDDYF